MAANQILANIIKVMLIFLTAIVVLGIISVFILIPMIIKVDEVETPDVRGKSLAESMKILQEHRLNAKIDSYKASSTVPEEYIIEQNPQPGFKVKQDKDIFLVLSSGTEKIEVPDLTGKLFFDAESEITSAGFQVGFKATVHSDNYPVVNTIIAQTPLPKSIVDRGAKISLLLSRGVYPKMLLMPDLRGMKFNDIQGRLEDSGLAMSKITFKPNPTYGDGIILAQFPPAGQLIQAGQKVELQVSSYTGVATRAQRPVVIEYTVTYGGTQLKRVRIILEDSKGSRQIVDDFFPPGKTITRLDSVIGEATMIIYENDMEHPIQTKGL
ncbi:TPA: PASTA domain-containing protein [Candidatus Poribacteria bacterium]|nr:PASTA domain-containing protein [Candidatus Poribacteria bacterium]